MRRALLPFVALAALALARTASAACNKANVCTAADLASCCSGTKCTIDGSVTIANAPNCTLDFGIKDVTVGAGGRVVVLPGNRLAITAGSFKVSRGKLLGLGTHTGALVGSPGAEIAIDTTGAVTIEQSAEIDVSGGGADGMTGGGRFLVTTADTVTVNASTIHADGYEASYAGEIRLTSGGAMGMGGNPLEIVAEGGSGGRIELDAGGALTLGNTGRFRANLVNHGSGSGGTIDVEGATITSNAVMEATGGDGEIDITAHDGALVIDRQIAGLSVDSDVDVAGDITLVTDKIGTGTMRVDAPISATGTAADAGGGTVTLDSAATLSFSTDPQNPDSINVSGFAEAETSDLEFKSVGDMTLHGVITGIDAPGSGLTLTSGRTIRLGGQIALTGRIGTDGDGGSLDATADEDVIVERGGVIDVSASGNGDGGAIGIDAGRNVTVEAAQGGKSAANLLANPGTASGSGGAIAIAAGSEDVRGFKQTGNLTLGGLLSVKSASAITQAGTIDVQGCQVEITGTLDATADTGPSGTTSILARKMLHVAPSATLKARVSNTVTYDPSTLPVVDAGATVTPPLMPIPGTLCTTGPNVPTVGCIQPCPQCGNATVEGPWEQCEPTADHCVDPNQCNDRCRSDVACAGTTCRDAFCDPNGGCFRLNKPNGTDCTPQNVNFCDGPQACSTGDCVAVAPPPAGCCDRNLQQLCPKTDPCIDRTCDGTMCVPSNIPAPACCKDTTDCDAVQSCSVCNPQTNQCELVPGCCTSDADCEDGNPCTLNTCNVGMKQCNAPQAMPDGPVAGCMPTQCSDGGTINTLCVAGACEQGADEPCPDDGDACTQEGSDSNGCCVHQLVSVNCCSDVRQICPGQVDACTTVSCNANNVCEATVLQDCIACASDANCPLPLHLCDEVHCTDSLTCAETAIPGCKTCNGDDDCDPITPGLCGQSVCRGGICVANTPPNCSDGDTATVDECQEANGQATCVHSCVDDRPCSDGNVCNGVESRVNCHCVTVQAAPSCKGDDPCTDYGCDPATGCTQQTRKLVPGVNCRLGIFEQTLAGVPSTALTKGNRKKMTKFVAMIRTKTAATGTGSVKTRTKVGKTAQTQLTGLTKLLAKQKKIDPTTLAKLKAALQQVGSELAAVRASITP